MFKIVQLNSLFKQKVVGRRFLSRVVKNEAPNAQNLSPNRKKTPSELLEEKMGNMVSLFKNDMKIKYNIGQALNLLMEERLIIENKKEFYLHRKVRFHKKAKSDMIHSISRHLAEVARDQRSEAKMYPKFDLLMKMCTK